MGIPEDHPAIVEAVRRGLIPPPTPDPPPQPLSRRPAPPLLEPGLWITGGGRGLEIAVPYLAVSEANAREWQARNRRAGQAWAAVRTAIGPDLDVLEPFARRLADGHPIGVRFVRVGGRRLDTMSNLPMALKGIEDATAYLLGITDASPLWRPACEQEPAAADGRCGVRVFVSTVEG